MPSVLIIDDEPNIRRMVGALLQAEGYDVREAASGADGVRAIADDEPDIALLDLMMPGELDGLATLSRIRERWSDLPVVMMSGRASLGDAVRATKLGAVNFLEKPLAPETVILSLSSAFELRRTRRAARALREELGLTGQMVGSSGAMARVGEVIQRVAPSESRVLIMGESGTGKELVAAAIHDQSPRRDRPFIRVNCAAIPRDLVESEMFGHEKGSFTGATSSRVGRFELAHTGTLFLDEIGDLNVEAQAKLLRAIEAKEIQRVGGNRTISVDVRVIAATNKDLARAVSEGTFREDLYFRLNVIPLSLPPLRERGDDVVELVRHFSALQHQRTGRPSLQWTDDALALMRAYAWPGNVRELANIVERLAIMNDGARVSSADVRAALPTRAQGRGDAPADGSSDTPRSLTDALDTMERSLITDALARADGSVAEAARQLNTDRPNLYRRMKRLGITGVALFALLLPGTFRGQAAPVAGTAAPAVSDSTTPDSIAPIEDEWENIPRRHRGLLSFAVTSGKTYNRVEGLPIVFGPTLALDGRSLQIHGNVFGIVRTVGPIRLAPPAGGYNGRLDTRFGRALGHAFVVGAGIQLYDVVAPIEPWQMTEPEAGISAFLLHRDFLDYYNRHGARANLGWYGTPHLSVIGSYADERWTSRSTQDPYTLFRNAQTWRANPRVDEGELRLATLDLSFDTRTDEHTPSSGWWLRGTYEYGHSPALVRGARDTMPITGTATPADYGRVFFDLRRYTRVSPRSQLNARVVFGGWVHGDELPLQRKLSIGGPGTLPGYDFRMPRGDANVQTCSNTANTPSGDPALCDRVVMAQVEFRTELASGPFGVSNAGPMRLRAAGFTTRPVGVLFMDVGRGWRTTEPWPSSYKADAGIGLDLGLFGIYAAKSVTDWHEAANLFLRVRRRF